MKKGHFIFVAVFFLTFFSCQRENLPLPEEDPYEHQGKIIGYLKWTESYEPEERFYYQSSDEKRFIYSLVNEIHVRRLQDTDKQEYEDLMRHTLGEIEIQEWGGDLSYMVELKEVRHRKKRIHALLMNEQTGSIRDVYDFSKDRSVELTFGNGITVRFGDHVDQLAKETILKTFNLKLERDLAPICEIYTSPKESDVLTVANQMYETGFFKYAYPSIYMESIDMFLAHRSHYPPSYENIPPPDILFGMLVCSLNDTLLTFSLPPDFLGLDTEYLQDGVSELDGDSVRFNSRDAEAEEVEYYEFLSPFGLPLEDKYRQVIVTDIKKR